MKAFYFILFICCAEGYPSGLPALPATSHWPRNPLAASGGRVIYFNDFNSPVGSDFPEWSSPGYSYYGGAVSGAGPQKVTNVLSPNGAQSFLGEFGGPYVVPPGCKPVIRVDETILLSLNHLAAHKSLTVEFDLYILKSWDGNSPVYGPDRFRLNVAGGDILTDMTFSNNPKVAADGSLQDYPSAGSAPQTGAFSVGTLGYSNYFKDSIYHLKFTFGHMADSLQLNFFSSLFEGKGTADESWGLDNVRVSTIR